MTPDHSTPMHGPCLPRTAVVRDPNYLRALLRLPFVCRLCGETHQTHNTETDRCLQRFAAPRPIELTLQYHGIEDKDPTFTQRLYAAANAARLTTLSSRLQIVTNPRFQYRLDELARPDAKAWISRRLHRWAHQTTRTHLDALVTRLETEWASLLESYPGPHRALRQALTTLQGFLPRHHPSANSPDVFWDLCCLEFDVKVQVVAHPEHWSARAQAAYTEERLETVLQAGLQRFIAQWTHAPVRYTRIRRAWSAGSRGRWLICQVPTPRTPADVIQLARTARAIQRAIRPAQQSLVSEAGWHAHWGTTSPLPRTP